MGSDEVDAALLQMITLGYFHNKPKEKAVEHLRSIQKELQIEAGFLLRYKHSDDFGVQKSAFLVCSFWLIEALILLDFVDEADKVRAGRGAIIAKDGEAAAQECRAIRAAVVS